MTVNKKKILRDNLFYMVILETNKGFIIQVYIFRNDTIR